MLRMKPPRQAVVAALLVVITLSGVTTATAVQPETGVAETPFPGAPATVNTASDLNDVGSGAGPGTPDHGLLAPAALPGSAPVVPADAAAAPQLQRPPRTRPRRAGPAAAGVAALTSPITSVVCKLDALGNVADIVIVKQDGTVQLGCTGGTATSVLTGGRNVVLDFSDSLIVQVQQGKLTPEATGPVSWLMFRTDSADARTCGFNVRPSSAQAVLTSWQAAAGSRTALNDLTLSCATSQLQALATATFSAALPALTPLAAGVSVSCTRPFTQPLTDITDTESDACRLWVLNNPNAAKPRTKPSCPPTSPSRQWFNNITRQQLPTRRPPNWPYRAVSSAITSVKLSTRRAWTGGNPSYITAKVQHASIPGVTSAMVAWWFNGNIDGDMVLPGSGAVYPRYLVWHPRDHVSQDTLIPGPTPGSIKGAYLSIIEFAGAPIGYNKSSPSWDNNYRVVASNFVHDITLNSVELREVVDGNAPFRLVHTWSDTTMGGVPALAMNSTLYMGIQPPFDDILAAQYMNPVAFQLFGGNCVMNAANAWVKHTVEEMGNLQFFLPALYQSSG